MHNEFVHMRGSTCTYAFTEEELFKNLAKRYSVDPAVFGVGESSTTF
jgi:hypothetical protein